MLRKGLWGNIGNQFTSDRAAANVSLQFDFPLTLIYQEKDVIQLSPSRYLYRNSIVKVKVIYNISRDCF